MLHIPNVLITHYLELHPDNFKPVWSHDDRMSIQELVAVDVAYYRFMYNTVGEKWNWTDRLLHSDDEIRDILSNPHTRTFVMYYGGAPAGYVELTQRGNGDTEIVYFGLREEYFGKGFGKHLLSFAVMQAIDDGARRIVLNTCNLDGPHALDNYRKRGFQVYDCTEVPMPDKEYVKLSARQKGLYWVTRYAGEEAV